MVAFGGEQSERERYDSLLRPGLKAGKIRGIFTGLGDSFLKSMLFICSAGAFWYGAHLILDDRFKEPQDQEYTPAILMIVSVRCPVLEMCVVYVEFGPKKVYFL